jgi:hypothetical protein
VPLVFNPRIAGPRLTSPVPVSVAAPVAAPDAVEFAQTRLGLKPDEAQCEVLRSTSRWGILNCTRQWGKSTVSVAKALHRALTVPKCLVLVASPGERQSGEWLRKAEDMLAQMDIPIRRDGKNSISLLMPNQSRIVGLPGNEAKVRSFSAVSMLLIDEASRVDEAMYKALRPMLAVGDGDLWLMSTPNGKQGFFYESWEHGGDDWLRVSVPATECPRIPKRFLEEQRGVMGKAWFQQEHMCEFVDGTVGVFDRAVVERALDDDVEPLWE